MAQEIKQEIEDFKPYIPLIQGLRNPGMRQRHWDMVSLCFLSPGTLVLGLGMALRTVNNGLGVIVWLGGRVVRTLDLRSISREFES